MESAPGMPGRPSCQRQGCAPGPQRERVEQIAVGRRPILANAAKSMGKNQMRNKWPLLRPLLFLSGRGRRLCAPRELRSRRGIASTPQPQMSRSSPRWTCSSAAVTGVSTNWDTKRATVHDTMREPGPMRARPSQALALARPGLGFTSSPWGPAFGRAAARGLGGKG